MIVDAIARWEDEGGATGGPKARMARTAGTARRAAGARDARRVPTSKRTPSVELPVEIADWITRPLASFFRVEVAAAVTLLVATVAALVLTNSGAAGTLAALWETPVGLRFGAFEFSRSLRHWINDGFLTVFFFVVALELKRELVLGELRNLRTAALSFAGALGGIVAPVAVYLLLMIGEPGVRGWGTVTATSAAFVVGSLALLGSRIPPVLRVFLLSIAILDDIGAILVVAIGYGDAVHWIALAAAAFGVLVLAGTARAGIRSIPVYVGLGVAIWLCFDASGIHPTLTGVALGLMTPTRRWVSNIRLRAILGRVLSHPRGEHAGGDTLARRDLQQAGKAARESSSPVERLELMLHPWVGFAILPVFALANAGVAFSDADLSQPICVAIVVAFVVGKPLGVLGASWLAVRLGLATRPPGLTWPLVAGGGMLAGIGFVMALFVAGLALAPEQIDDARLAILVSSVVSALAGVATLFWLTSRKRRPHGATSADAP